MILLHTKFSENASTSDCVAVNVMIDPENLICACILGILDCP